MPPAFRGVKRPLIPLMQHLQIPSEKTAKAEFKLTKVTSVIWEKIASTIEF